jgi:sensor histidine kinase YesM
VPPVFLTWVVALSRRRLLQPEWGLWRTLAVHNVVGLLFAFTTSALSVLISEAFGKSVLESMPGAPPWVNFLLNAVFGVFIYLIFIGILMWSESVRRVHESNAMAAREAVLRAEAEAKAVRAQFNPHFVFNTLHSLMLLVRADPTAAERAIEDVATLIRYASILQRQDIDAVPLSKELEVARRYVSLEKLRLEDRLEVVWDIEPGVEAMTIPAFALQTLVENAIKHGVEPETSGGTVSVEVRMTGDRLSAVVSDDGAGADSETVLRKGHGLELLSRRLFAKYGDRGTLTWTTSPGDGFEVRVAFPAEALPPRAGLGVIQDSEATAAHEEALGA